MSSPVLCGEMLLSTIQDHNLKYDWGHVYRGSPEYFESVTPQPTVWRRHGREYPDSAVPVVCADTSPCMPTFFALTPGIRKRCLVEPVTYDLFEEDRSVLMRGAGYVAVLNGANFTPGPQEPPVNWPDPTMRRPPEVRCTEECEPLYSVAVAYRDFVALLIENGGTLRYFATDSDWVNRTNYRVEQL